LGLIERLRNLIEAINDQEDPTTPRPSATGALQLR
jgi:hypothetical protein